MNEVPWQQKTSSIVSVPLWKTPSGPELLEVLVVEVAVVTPEEAVVVETLELDVEDDAAVDLDAT